VFNTVYDQKHEARQPLVRAVGELLVPRMGLAGEEEGMEGLIRHPNQHFFNLGSCIAIGRTIELREAYFAGIAAPCGGFEALAPAGPPSFSWPA
jgi:hypothetical protein